VTLASAYRPVNEMDGSAPDAGVLHDIVARVTRFRAAWARVVAAVSLEAAPAGFGAAPSSDVAVVGGDYVTIVVHAPAAVTFSVSRADDSWRLRADSASSQDETLTLQLTYDSPGVARSTTQMTVLVRPRPRVEYVVVSPSPGRIPAGTSATFTAAVYDEHFETLSDREVTWEVVGSGVSPMAGTGAAFTVTAGAAETTVTLRATVEGVTRDVQVHVIPPYAGYWSGIVRFDGSSSPQCDYKPVCEQFFGFNFTDGAVTFFYDRFQHSTTNIIASGDTVTAHFPGSETVPFSHTLHMTVSGNTATGTFRTYDWPGGYWGLPSDSVGQLVDMHRDP
jgi:hypothetical protein